jgi:hypothetical protein
VAPSRGKGHGARVRKARVSGSHPSTPTEKAGIAISVPLIGESGGARPGSPQDGAIVIQLDRSDRKHQYTMIIFDLKCSKGHTFEGWFEDADAFQTQSRENLVTCPVCEDTQISKIFSPISIKSSPTAQEAPLQPAEMQRMVKKISEYVEKHFDDVGCKFASEALKIHYGVTEPRNIRGVSTEQEEKMLKDEGVEFFKVPSIPSENTDT